MEVEGRGGHPRAGRARIRPRVFVLAYYGAGAKQFSGFLERRAATVKLGLSFPFLGLGGWLLMSLM